MRLSEIHNVYFVGIGGIGMSALARWFKANGAQVAGYDRTETTLTQALAEEGIPVIFEDSIAHIEENFKRTEETLVIYTPAIPDTNSIMAYFVQGAFNVQKRAAVLGIITRDRYSIAVAGTHGKTTTSSIIAHLLSDTEMGCSAFVGGVMTNTGSNLIIGNEKAPVVVEADEYDRSFMQLHPDYTIITSIDPDHLDIYGDEGAMQATYAAFAEKLPSEGTLLIHRAAQTKFHPAFPSLTYDIEEGDVMAHNVRIDEGVFVFDYASENHNISELQLQLPGYHNVTNAVAAITVALDQGMDPGHIKRRLKSYAGVKRRFEYVLKSTAVTLVDDYAHHPREIAAVIHSIRSMAAGKKLTVIFQPHLYSRTQDFKQGFAEALDLADEVLLLDIYPARERPIAGVTSKIIYDLMKTPEKAMVAKDDLIGELASRSLDYVLTLGAGDIDKEVPKVAEFFKSHYVKHKTSIQSE